MLRLPPEDLDEELEEDFVLRLPPETVVLRLPPEELVRTVVPLERLPPEVPTLPEVVRLPPSVRTVVPELLPPFFGVGVLRPP